MTGPIGILGGYGAVGTEAARLLSTWGFTELRIGGRDRARSTVAVDIHDDASLSAFVEGCEVVVNCAPASRATAVRVACAARAAGAGYVDAGTDPGTLRADGPSAVFAAGALPGLSGLLPRWLARREFDQVHELTFYAGVFDRFTATGAEDFLRSVLGGSRRAELADRQHSVSLPFFPRVVSTFPYLDAEGERLARDLGLRRVTCYSVLGGEHLRLALDAARTLPTSLAVAELCRASALDVAGRTPYVTFLIQLDGHRAGTPITRTAVLRAPGIAQLTGFGVAAATCAVSRGEVPPGDHLAATTLDPETTIATLAEINDLTVLDAPIDQLALAEEGVL